MVKGAAGQAVQNMNLMFGLAENTGLKQIPMFPDGQSWKRTRITKNREKERKHEMAGTWI